MSLVYDLIFVFIIVLMIRRGWRHGVLATLLRLLGWVAAAFVIMNWAGPWAERLYQTTVKPIVLNAVASAIPADALTAMNSTADAVESLQAVLGSLAGILGGWEIDASAATTIIAMLRTDGASLAEAITETVLKPVLLGIIQAALSLVILIVCLAVFRILARISGGGRRGGRGVLGKVNRFLGAVLGAAEGLAVAYVYAFLLAALAGVVNTNWLTPALVNSTSIVSKFL